MKVANNSEWFKESPLSKFIEYVLYIFIVLFPFISYPSFLYPGTSARSVNLILLASILGISFSIWLFKKRSYISIPKSPILLVAGVYLLFIVISALAGLSFSNSFWSIATRTTGVWYLLNLGFILYLLVGAVGSIEKRNRFILCVVFSTAVYSLFSFLSPEGVNWLFKNYVSDAFTFGNSTFAAMYIFGAFILFIYYILQSEKKRWWMFLVPIILLINPNIINFRVWSGNFSQGIVGEARATTYLIIFSLVSLFFIWLISKIKNQNIRSKTAYSIFGIGIVVMIIAAFSLLSNGGYLNKLYLSQATAARPLIWETSYKVIAQRPLLGWGMDNFERVFEINYDNRLLQQSYGNEAWFDRAHNIFIDQLIENGYIGLILYILLYLTIIWSMIYVSLNSTEKKDRIFSSVLIVYFIIHFIELQTAFETTISYPMVILMMAFAVSLFSKTRGQIIKNEQEWRFNNWIKYSIASMLAVFFIWSFIWGWIPFVRAQMANGYIRTIGSVEGRIRAYPILLDSPVDTHSFLWRMSTDFQIAIGSNPRVLEDPAKIESLRKEVIFFENAYKEYLNKNPNHFRAHLNLADMLIYQRLLGVDKLMEAQEVLDNAIKLVPQAPQSYWMKAVAYIYMMKFDLAREYAQKGLDLNPEAKQSLNVVKYVEESIKNFPEIDLYFFSQI